MEREPGTSNEAPKKEKEKEKKKDEEEEAVEAPNEQDEREKKDMFLGNNCNEEQSRSSLQKPNQTGLFPFLRFQIATLRCASQYELSLFQ
ncbi:hypothetical protein TIFTF001_007069 [Ficus carica]|uniref:Uncharacterized protein n=1 Tax=Ficus carica TaxID=3494 RepID=A0AA87ZQA6_FICCA|nr:hypothetical protein TIFTF001_007069 [Ficus carica]